MVRTIPKGWQKYKPLGQCVPGTKIIPFKVPLTLDACKSSLPEEEWFTPSLLLQKQPQLKTIIDLTDTSRYYDPQDFRSNGVAHIKINITGGGKLPSSFKIRQFFKAVDEFMENFSEDPDALIGVHCTHGLNRTGYFICSYMVQRLKFSPQEALAKFESARGYPIERDVFVNSIKKLDLKEDAVPKNSSLPKDRSEYSSPLDNSYDDYKDSFESTSRHERRRLNNDSKPQHENWRDRNSSSQSNNKDVWKSWKKSKNVESSRRYKGGSSSRDKN